jgi:hypothetical protein
MTAFAKGLVTFLLEVARYAFMQYRDGRRDRMRRKRKMDPQAGGTPDENFTGNRNSQREPISGQTQSKDENFGAKSLDKNIL